MTTTVSKVTITALASHDAGALAMTAGLIAIGVLIALLIQKEMLRAAGGPRAVAGAAIVNATIAPLLLTLLLTVIVRLAHLAHGA